MDEKKVDKGREQKKTHRRGEKNFKILTPITSHKKEGKTVERVEERKTRMVE